MAFDLAGLTEKISAFGFGSFALGIALGFGFAVLYLLICWRLATRVGFKSWTAFLMLIPILNFILLLVFTFGKWPIEAELDKLQKKIS